MRSSNPLMRLFGQSPFKPLQEHMREVVRCANEVPALFEALCEQDLEKLKAVKGEIRGIGGSPGVVEGLARIVKSPQEFDSVQQGEIMVCVMTNPAWVVVFSKVAAIVTDAGGVLLKIKSLEQAQAAFDQITANIKKHDPKARIDGILIEEMARGGIEVILGATRSPGFGPMCMFGLGGVFVEALKDVTFRLAPMWEASAANMIRAIKAYHILQGVRGNPPADIEAIKLCILRLSQLVSDHPEIKELDINPLIVYPEGEGCVVADSRILLSRPEK